jgi:predicted kinase
MEATCENSPWHREANVAVHTEMILDHYLTTTAPSRSPRQQAITLLTILFHDTGKPAAKKDKHTEERGDYQSFGGHEHLSARIFEDYAVKNWAKWKNLRDTFELKETDLYVIMWIIENHLPHNFERPNDKQRICNQLHSEVFDNGDLANCFFDQLLSDQTGRISDAHEKNLREVVEFIEDIKSLVPDINYNAESPENDTNRRELVVMIGASGSGKSTYCDSLRAKGYAYISLDALRIEYGILDGCTGKNAIELYKNCFDYCDTHRSGFRHFSDKRYNQYLEQFQNIVVDNTNVNHKSRDGYVSEAKLRNYKVTMVLFPIDKDKLISRAKTRTDKQVPIFAVLDQYNRITMPWINLKHDAENIVVRTTNIDGMKV